MTDSPDPDTEARKTWMAVLARAGADEMATLLAPLAPLPEPVVLRGPETGLVMVRGRAGGGGAPFNLGEMTVTRCTVRAGAHRGHATVAGRDPARALLAARLDAALQDPARRDAIQEAVVAPLAARQAAARDERAARAAATRVDFFTLQTMRT
jgi:alpha-D-ribose 1-methylphosphonate 5-triphosphate synthase subunit PhnG